MYRIRQQGMDSNKMCYIDLHFFLFKVRENYLEQGFPTFLGWWPGGKWSGRHLYVCMRTHTNVLCTHGHKWVRKHVRSANRAASIGMQLTAHSSQNG